MNYPHTPEARTLEGSISADTVREEIMGKLYQWGIIKHSEEIESLWFNVEALNNETVIPYKVVFRPERKVTLRTKDGKGST